MQFSTEPYLINKTLLANVYYNLHVKYLDTIAVPHPLTAGVGQLCGWWSVESGNGASGVRVAGWGIYWSLILYRALVVMIIDLPITNHFSAVYLSLI